MNRKVLITKEIITFKKWSSKSWSVFSSLGKQIKIALLPLSYFLGSFLTLSAQTDTISIEDVQIISARVPTLQSESARVIYTIEKNEIEAMPVHSLQDLIEYVSNVDVRQRGTEGIQADISIRGGNFEQTLILLNGFKMNDAQTGHHNMNLPVDIESVEKIEILQGPGNRIFGINAYSGAINFITNTETAKKLKLSFFAGQNNYFGGNIGLFFNQKTWKNHLSVSQKTSDGYLSKDSINNTDFKTLNIFYETKYKYKNINFIIQTGFSNKSFGANSFYTPKYPWQYENTKTFFAGYKTIKKGKKYNFVKSFFWRRHQDRFELFREDKYIRKGNYFINNKDTAGFGSGYFYKSHNYHKTNLISSILKYDIKTIAGKTGIGAEYRHVFIKSNVLGNEMEHTIDVPFEKYGKYTKDADRYNVNLYAEHVFKYKSFLVAGGFSSNYNSDFNWHTAGGIDASYNFTNNLKIFTSLNQALRLPTFTDLYYDGPINKGNPDLMPETAITYELGLKYRKKWLRIDITSFKRNGKNTIDWVRLSDTVDWQAQNITELSTFGADISVSYIPIKSKLLKKLSFSYSYINISKQSGNYISKYALDYLKHKAIFSSHLKLYKRIYTSFNIRYEDREGSFAVYNLSEEKYIGEQKYKAFILADLKVYWKNRNWEIYSVINNISDSKYYEFGNILMPGRQFKLGVRFNFNL